MRDFTLGIFLSVADVSKNRKPNVNLFVLRPKIKFYLFAIAYLPTILPPTQLFFCFFRTNFFFFTFSIFQVQSELLKLYKLTRKKPKGSLA